MENTDHDAELTLARLEAIPYSNWHRKLLIIGFFAVFFDAADFSLFGAVLPPIAHEYHLNPQQAGFVATIGLAGASIGAIFYGTISDYIGRRSAFNWALIIFSLFTGFMGLAWSTLSLGVFRFISNIGLGGQVPVTTALVTEFMPKDIRGRTAGSIVSGFGLGQIVAALAGLLIVPNFGWRPILLLGFFPLVLLWFARGHVPESVRYYLGRGRFADARRMVEKIELASNAPVFPARQASVAAATTVKEAHISHVPVVGLLSPEFARRTILLWISSIGILWAGNGIIFMLPTILTERGMSLRHALSYTLVYSICGVLGYLSSAYCMDKFGRRPVLITAMITAALCYIWFAQADGIWLYVSVGAGGFFTSATSGGTVIYANEIYPTHLRATGVGWYYGVGRIGSFLAPLVIGSMIFHGYRDYTIYTFSVAFIVSAVTLFAIGIETRGRVLDTI